MIVPEDIFCAIFSKNSENLNHICQNLVTQCKSKQLLTLFKLSQTKSFISSILWVKNEQKCTKQSIVHALIVDYNNSQPLIIILNLWFSTFLTKSFSRDWLQILIIVLSNYISSSFQSQLLFSLHFHFGPCKWSNVLMILSETFSFSISYSIFKMRVLLLA